MAKKIKREKILTEEEQKAEEAKKQEDAQRAAAGIQDDFQARGFELVEWMQERQGLVLGVIAAIVGAGLAYGVYNAVQSSRNEDASVALAEALAAWEAPIGEAPTATPPVDAAKPGEPELMFKDAAARNTAARAAFEKAAAAHGSTGVGALAHLYAAHAAVRLGDVDNAAKDYQAFLDATGPKDPLRFAGYAGLARALESKGDVKGAIAALESQVNLADQTDEDGALLALGRLYQKDGNAEAAKKSLERVGKDFPESSLKSKAEELLAALGAPAPVPSGLAPNPGEIAIP